MNDSSNIKVARHLVELAADGTQDTTVRAVTEATNIHSTQVGDFLRMWTAIGWFTKKRMGHHGFVFTFTKTGLSNLQKLIERHDCG